MLARIDRLLYFRILFIERSFGFLVRVHYDPVKLLLLCVRMVVFRDFNSTKISWHYVSI